MPGLTQIFINGRARPWQPALTLAEALRRDDCEAEAVATAVNGEFVSRARRLEHVLQPGDQVTLFQAIVGG